MIEFFHVSDLHFNRKKGVKEFGARNEANHDSQATWKSPKRGSKLPHSKLSSSDQ